MTAISSTNLSQLFAAQRPQHSGKNRVSDALQSETASGQISASDSTALTSALSAIDSSLSAGGASAQGSSSTTTASSGSDTRLDPSKIKDRIDGLIGDQVSNGTLTSAQADTLKQLFSAQAPGQNSTGDDQDAFSLDATGSSGGTGRVGHGHGHRPPPPSDASDTGASATSSSATTGITASGGSSTGSVSDLLKSFIDQLQASQSSASGYTGGGTSGSGSRQASALLFDFNS